MAEFHTNKCKYANCDRTFENLPDLIYHIEDVHLDFDPAVLEQNEKQKPQSVPLSYVLRFSQIYRDPLPTTKEVAVNAKNDGLSKCKGRGTGRTSTSSASTKAISSNSSWSNDSNSENLTHYVKATSEILYKKKESMRAKKIACPIPGCNKRYKSISGIKYHTRNGHGLKKNYPAKARKFQTCRSGKIYKTMQGMEAHCVLQADTCIDIHEDHSPMLSGPNCYADSD